MSHKHYTAFRKYGNPLGIRRKCKVTGCHKWIYPMRGRRKNREYCSQHQYRLDRNLPLNLDVDYRVYCKQGKRNPRWSGGHKGYYENHGLLKSQRRIRMLLAGGICEVKGCQKEAKQIYHLNRDTNDHRLENLIVICRKCRFKHFPYKKKRAPYKKRP